jgi:hypothetical protein
LVGQDETMGNEGSKILAERFDAFLLDLDGVVYLGDEPLPGSREALARLREAGKKLRFLTNDPRPTREQLRRQLAGMDVEAWRKEVITSGWATARYLAQESISSAYVKGGRGLASEIEAAGIASVLVRRKVGQIDPAGERAADDAVVSDLSDLFVSGTVAREAGVLGRNGCLYDEAHVRPPLRRISEAERENIRRVVTEAGLPRGEQSGAAAGGPSGTAS